MKVIISLDASQSFSARNSLVDAFTEEGNIHIIKVQLPQEAFMSVLKMD